MHRLAGIPTQMAVAGVPAAVGGKGCLSTQKDFLL